MYRLNPLHSKLSRRFFIVIVGIIVAIFTIIYAYSVPLIKQKVFEIERQSSRVTLNNVFEIANRMYSNIEEYRAQGLQSHQQQLKVAVAITEAYLRNTLQEAHKKGIAEGQALQQAFSTIRDFNYGNKDYIWIAIIRANCYRILTRVFMAKIPPIYWITMATPLSLPLLNAPLPMVKVFTATNGNVCLKINHLIKSRM